MSKQDKKINNKIGGYLRAMKGNLLSIVVIIAVIVIVTGMIINWGATIYQIGRFFKIITPFIAGIILAFLVSPLVDKIHWLLKKITGSEDKKSHIRTISIAISYVIVLVFLGVTLVYIVPQVIKSFKDLTVSLRDSYKFLIENPAEVQRKYPILPMESIVKYLHENVSKISVGYGKDFATFVFPYIFNFSRSIVSGVVNIIFSIVISCYFVIDKAKIAAKLKEIIYVFYKKKNAPMVWNTIRECNHIFNGFLVGKMIDSLIIGILCLIIMNIIGLPYSILFSVIVGITNMIPYFGPFIGAIPGVVIYLVIEPKNALIFAIMIFLLQQFDGLYLGPKILGDLTGIKPLMVIFGITVGGAYFGVIGMFLGVPTVAVIVHLIKVFYNAKKDKMSYKQSL